MPKRTDIKSILIIGAGPLVIGQACEFDYSGTQACKALRAEGYRIVLVNSNPATIMTDPDLADATYIEPITPEIVAKIIEKERHAIPGGFALLPTMGGQTALNCALSLRQQGTLEKFDVEMIGATADAIDKAEDRQLFREAMTKIGLETPKSRLANASALKKSFRDKRQAEREKLSGAALEEHDRQWALGQALVPLPGRRGVGVQTGDEDDPGDLPVEQHVDVLVLGHPARGLGAQHRGVAVVGQRGLDHLGEGREDRIVQLRHDQPDQPGRVLPQPHRPLVTEHVQRRHDRPPRLGGDAGPVVEDPRDRRLAHPGLHGDVG